MSKKGLIDWELLKFIILIVAIAIAGATAYNLK